MLTQAQRDQFESQGYIIFENFFSDAEIASIQSQIDQFDAAHQESLRRHADGDKGVSRANEISFTMHLAEQDEAIMQFCRSPKLVDLAVELLGQDISLYWDQSVYKYPEGKREFPWHQDNGYIPVEPERYLTCWIALEDATVENGCVWVQPGTHLGGTVEHRDTPIGKQCYFGDDPGIPVPLKRGGMVVFSSLLFHRSGANASKSIRKGYIVQFAPADARHQITKEPFKMPAIARNGQPV
jgi:phytanoyl-CoA hydroxylase